MLDYDAAMRTLHRRLSHMAEQRPFRFVATRRVLAEAYLAQQTQCMGYRDDEIHALEHQLAVSLPPVFHAYLRTFGHARGPLFAGSDATPAAMPTYRGWAAELVAESGASSRFLLPEIVIFLFHQGYAFCYFHATKGDNPPIYTYTEGDRAPQGGQHTFLDFLTSEITAMEHVHRDQFAMGGYFVQIQEGSVHQTHPARAGQIRPLDCADRYVDD